MPLTPWRRRRFRKASRWGLKAAGFLVLVVVLLLAVDLFQEDAPRFLSAAATALGAIAAVLTIVSLALSRSDAGPPRIDLRARKLRSERTIVDREAKLTELAERIRAGEVVSCHGPRGSGKSVLLQYVADVVNGHREPNPGHDWPRGVTDALYFDLSGATGFEAIETQVCRAAFGQDGSWAQFIGYVDREFSGRHVLLILDNLNSPSLWRPAGRAVFEYLLARDDDMIVVGSIDRVRFDAREVSEVGITGLDVGAFSELAALEGLALDDDEIAALHSQWNGLPYYAGPLGTRHAALAEQIQLTEGTRRLVAYAALLAVVTRRIPVRELVNCPVANFDEHLEEAIGERLLAPAPDGRMLEMHDIARDDVFDRLGAEVAEAAAILFERATRLGDESNAAVFAMFADPGSLGANRFDDVLVPVIGGAIDSRNYALLESLHEKSRSNQRLLDFLAVDRDRADLFSLSRASQLAGLGSYEAAEAELLNTSVGSSRAGYGAQGTQLQLDLRYLQADLAHLLNRYEQAAHDFESLAETAKSAGHDQLHARCVWAQGHVLRHQGRDLDRALALFERSEKLAEGLGMLSVKAQSITNASMIKVFVEAVDDEEEQRLSRIEDEVATSVSHNGHMLGIWKAQAQVDWIRGREERAIAKVEDTIGKASLLNDRLLYDLFFERAEFNRLSGNGRAALDDYDRALRFGTGNRDRNLMSNALLGLVLADLAIGSWVHHSSMLEARGSALRARDMADQADIQVTKQLADRVVAKLDGGVGEVPSRLIVF